MNDEDDDRTIGEQISNGATEDTESPTAITRSVHINTRYAIVTITTQAEEENIDKIREIAEELVDKYKEK